MKDRKRTGGPERIPTGRAILPTPYARLPFKPSRSSSVLNRIELGWTKKVWTEAAEPERVKAP
jgi:hypothetical protein